MQTAKFHGFVVVIDVQINSEFVTDVAKIFRGECWKEVTAETETIGIPEWLLEFLAE